MILIVFSILFAEHGNHLVFVLERFRKVGLTLKRSKCFLGNFFLNVGFLCHIVSQDGVGMYPDMVRIIRTFNFGNIL